MEKQKKKLSGLEIRVQNMEPKIYNAVVRHAKSKKRTIGKQSELLIEAGLKSLSNLETV